MPHVAARGGGSSSFRAGARIPAENRHSALAIGTCDQNLWILGGLERIMSDTGGVLTGNYVLDLRMSWRKRGKLRRDRCVHAKSCHSDCQRTPVWPGRQDTRPTEGSAATAPPRLGETARGSKPSGSLAASITSDAHMSWFAKRTLDSKVNRNVDQLTNSLREARLRRKGPAPARISTSPRKT